MRVAGHVQGPYYGTYRLAWKGQNANICNPYPGIQSGDRASYEIDFDPKGVPCQVTIHGVSDLVRGPAYPAVRNPVVNTPPPTETESMASGMFIQSSGAGRIAPTGFAFGMQPDAAARQTALMQSSYAERLALQNQTSLPSGAMAAPSYDGFLSGLGDLLKGAATSFLPGGGLINTLTTSGGCPPGTKEEFGIGQGGGMFTQCTPIGAEDPVIGPPTPTGAAASNIAAMPVTKTVRKCPPFQGRTMVLARDGLCYPKALVSMGGGRMNKRRPKPPVTRAQQKAIEQAKKAQETLIQLTKDAGAYAAKSKPKAPKPKPVVVTGSGDDVVITGVK